MAIVLTATCATFFATQHGLSVMGHQSPQWLGVAFLFVGVLVLTGIAKLRS